MSGAGLSVQLEASVDCGSGDASDSEHMHKELLCVRFISNCPRPYYSGVVGCQIGVNLRGAFPFIS